MHPLQTTDLDQLEKQGNPKPDTQTQESSTQETPTHENQEHPQAREEKGNEPEIQSQDTHMYECQDEFPEEEHHGMHQFRNILSEIMYDDD